MKILNSKFRKITFSAIVLLVFAGIGSIFVFSKSNTGGYVFETATVTKGSIYTTVTATGTLEATNTVVVGTQVSGVIEKLYADFNSKVKKGQLIAELDKSTLQSSLENAEADLYNAQAEYDYQESNYKRMKEVYDKGLLSGSDYDLAKYNYKKSEGALKSAKANLNKAKRNLGYATIYAPIDGIVLNRAVEEGQTVAASMSAPELFTIANDLTKMKVEANVDEADIGMVKKGQRVEFTVDAFPDITFKGNISEVRLQPTNSSNVITYTVVVTVSNTDLKLKPGMTASITAYVKEVNDILLEPGKATRFTPDSEVMASMMNNLNNNLPQNKMNQTQNADASKQGNSTPSGQTDGQASQLPENKKRIWVKENNSIKPVLVETGETDGSSIQIVSGLKEGDLVVTGVKAGTEAAVKKESSQTNPFMPTGPGGGAKKG